MRSVANRLSYSETRVKILNNKINWQLEVLPTKQSTATEKGGLNSTFYSASMT